MKNKSKLFLMVVLLGGLLGLQGCGSSGTETAPPPTGPSAYVPKTYPRFDPVTSDVPFNTDLLFAKAAATDGTADLGSPTDPVRAAINVMDGFSTSAYFDVLIEGSVNPATVIAGQTVFLAPLASSGDALDPTTITGFAMPGASYDAVVVSLDGGTNNVIRIRPTQPLKAKTKYLVFLTDDIKDSSGAALTRSWSYNSLRDPSYETLEALVPVRNAVLGWEQLASGYLAQGSGGALSVTAAKEKLVLTYTFTTTDPIAPLVAMASPRAAIASMQIAKGVDQMTAVTNAVNLDSYGLLPTPKARSLGISPYTGVDLGTLSGGQLASNVGKLYTGYIKLPYYQTAATGLPFAAYLTKSWEPDLALANALGVTVPADVDGSYNVTYRYPFAAKTTDESVPLQVTMPSDTQVPGYAGTYNCGQIYAATGYPVVIYVHGITSDRSSVVALAHTLASQCVATVAIDLPLHGVPGNSPFWNVLNVEHSASIPFATLYGDNTPHERHYNVAGAGGSPAPMNFGPSSATANDGSGAQFTNLGYLANTRDNNREGVVDLLNLNASLTNVNSAVVNSLGANVGLDLDRVYVVGISLGGILGEVFATVNEAAIANDMQVGLSSNLNHIQGLILSSAGSQVAQIMTNSATFAPVINAGLGASGVNVGTTNYERFVYTAQAIMDSADSVNFAQTLSQLGVPVLIQEVANDQVIPNVVGKAPLSGIQALASLLNTTQLGLGQTQLGLGHVKMTAGGHTSILRPEGDAPLVTAELQAQTASFIVGDGNVAVGLKDAAQVEAPAM